MSKAFSTLIHFSKMLKTASKRRRNAGKRLKASFPLRSCRGWSSHMATGVCGLCSISHEALWLNQRVSCEPGVAMASTYAAPNPLQHRGSEIQITNAQI